MDGYWMLLFMHVLNQQFPPCDCLTCQQVLSLYSDCSERFLKMASSLAYRPKKSLFCWELSFGVWIFSVLFLHFVFHEPSSLHHHNCQLQLCTQTACMLSVQNLFPILPCFIGTKLITEVEEVLHSSR